MFQSIECVHHYVGKRWLSTAYFFWLYKEKQCELQLFFFTQKRRYDHRTIQHRRYYLADTTFVFVSNAYATYYLVGSFLRKTGKDICIHLVTGDQVRKDLCMEGEWTFAIGKCNESCRPDELLVSSSSSS